VQYGAFLKGVAHGDLGQSLRNGQPVTGQILERMPATAQLALSSMAVAILFALQLKSGRSVARRKVAGVMTVLRL
jgi:ABC-type dipeptide/oligopeptide/nickel transport system permease component